MGRRNPTLEAFAGGNDRVLVEVQDDIVSTASALGHFVPTTTAQGGSEDDGFIDIPYPWDFVGPICPAETTETQSWFESCGWEVLPDGTIEDKGERGCTRTVTTTWETQLRPGPNNKLIQKCVRTGSTASPKECGPCGARA